MPNRIIKESIRTSKSVNALPDFLFRVWVYLITYVDDYGRGSADPQLLRGFLLPRKRVTESQIREALAGLADAGLIILYEDDGEAYLYFPKWEDHQRIRQKVSRFPAPPPIAADCGEERPESNPINRRRRRKMTTGGRSSGAPTRGKWAAALTTPAGSTRPPSAAERIRNF